MPVSKFLITSFSAVLLWAAMLGPPFARAARADETCNSPYLSTLIRGQEDYLYVWTLCVGERGEAHHVGFTDDRRFLWAGGLDSNKIHVFDVGANPARPKLVRTITDLGARSGLQGPHTFYALPGRMLVGTLSNAADGGGVTGLALSARLPG